MTVLALLTAPAAAAPGDVDAGFGTSGRVVTSGLAPASDVWVTAGGAIMTVSGSRADGSQSGIVLTEYRADGRLDSSFASDGSLDVSVSAGATGLDFRRAFVDVDSAGNSLIVFIGSAGGTAKSNVFGFDATGAPDPTIGGGDGQFQVDDLILEPRRDPQGRVVYFNDQDQVRRVRPDGSPDPTFAGSGSADPMVGTIAALEIGGSGTITVAGTTGVARLLPTGLPDPTFGAGGVVGIGGSDALSLFAVADDGGIYWAFTEPSGDGQSTKQLTHLLPNGQADPSFVERQFGDGAATAIEVDYANEPLLLGGFPDFMSVLRLRPDGGNDRGFGARGLAKVYFGLRSASASALTVTSDGSVVLAGGVGGGSKANQALVKLSAEPGRADADADGVADKRDACPLVAPARKHGCPVDRRHVTLTARAGGAIVGTIQARTAQCQVAPLKLQRMGRGKAQAHTLDKVRPRMRDGQGYVRVRSLKRGRYRLVARGRVAHKRAYCDSVKSRSVRVPAA